MYLVAFFVKIKLLTYFTSVYVIVFNLIVLFFFFPHFLVFLKCLLFPVVEFFFVMSVSIFSITPASFSPIGIPHSSFLHFP